MIRYLLLIFLLINSSVLFANGGPVDSSIATSAGGISFKQDKDASLESEILKISMNPDFATYNVVATYKIKSSLPKKVSFGVPLMGTIHGGGIFSRDVELSLNDTKHLCKPVKAEVFPESENRYEYSELDQGICIVDIELQKGMNKLVMSYKGSLEYIDWETTKSPFTEFSDRKLRYLFLPAGYWRGKVKKVDVEVKLNKLSDMVKKISLPDFKKKQGSLYWNLTDIDFKETKQLVINFSPEKLHSKYMAEWNKRDYVNSRGEGKALSSSTLSSQSKNTYAAGNVLDGNVNTAWCEGKKGPGKGEWIKINYKVKELPVFCGVKGLMVVPGYAKSPNTFRNNNRVKALEVGACDAREELFETIEFEDNNNTDKISKFFTMRDNGLEELSSVVVLDELWKKKYPDQKQHNKKEICIKYRVKDVYKGKKYNDTCISEIALVVHCP